MRELYKILEELDKRKVAHCFQSQGRSEYYNLAVTGPTGKQLYFNSFSIDAIERELKLVWGGLLNSAPPPPLPKPF